MPSYRQLYASAVERGSKGKQLAVRMHAKHIQEYGQVAI